MEINELSKLLAENLGYYVSGDTRCKRPATIDTNAGCFYSGTSVDKDTDGCFVGRLLPEEVRVELDRLDCGGFREVFNDIEDKGIDIKLPDYMMKNPDLMCDFQTLHDEDANWGRGYQLSDNGKSYLKDIIQEHKLILEDFEKFL
jgi:hypothetical protein